MNPNFLQITLQLIKHLQYKPHKHIIIFNKQQGCLNIAYHYNNVELLRYGVEV